MIYQLIDKHGQTHIGYFNVDPKTRKMVLIKRDQWRNRQVAIERMARRCQFTANISQRWLVQFVVGPDQGQIESYGTEQEARDHITAAMDKNAPAGLTRAIEAHLYHPTRPLPGGMLETPAAVVDVQAASAESWTPPA